MCPIGQGAPSLEGLPASRKPSCDVAPRTRRSLLTRDLALPPRLCQATGVLWSTMLRLTVWTALGLSTYAVPTTVRAGEINPAVEACVDRAEGDGCSVRNTQSGEVQSGQCTTDECCELDYSGGSPPQTTCAACLACKPGVPRPTPTPPEVNADDGNEASQGEPQRTAPQPPPATPNDKPGCTIGGGGWSWIVLLGLAPVMLKRRRDS